ncbi:MAG: hypothetical protein J6T01_03070, partial [Kiritimatiellae bacterium]|nr:hypothetical protein [Kiritimatiellia bacterium]
MHKSVCCMLTAVAAIVYSAVLAQEKNAIIPRPLPQPVVRVPDLRAEEKPIAVEKTEKEVAADKFFRRVRASFVFTNPNHRVMQGEFEFPIPDEAFVCGYSLEINGSMVPGVVCEKEKARVAFENEVRKGVDPGIVEQVKGNLWRTRIFPLNPNTPRRAEVDYIAPAANASEGEIFERDGDNVFAATSQASQTPQTSQTFPSGWIFWDASLSRLDKTAADRKRLEEILPEKGSWKLVVFSNRPAAPVDVASRDELLKLVDAAVCDGGTDIASALALAPGDAPKLLFTDEVDTLGTNNDWENVPNLAIASRPPAPKRAVEVRKLSAEEAAKVKEAKESILLATVWASRRMTDLASQADARKDEFLALGRKYCVAGPGLSLIVLETLQQYLDHKIEPPKSMSFHDEWVKRRAADDDPIAEKRARARFEAQLLRYWEERVKWWKNPIPERPKPRSGLFDRMISAVTHSSSSSRRAPVAMSAAANEESGAVAEDLEESPAVESAAPGAARSAPRALGAGR